MRFIIAFTQSLVAAATNSRVLTYRENISYVVSQERVSGLLFQSIVSTMRVLIIVLFWTCEV